MKRVSAVVRWTLFGGQIVVAFVAMGLDPRHLELNPPSPFHVVAGMVLLAGSVFWIIPETISPIAEFIGECWAGLLFPNARFQKPPLSYLLADFYSTQGRHEEAIHEYLKILRYYPNERRAYLGVISLCNTIGASETAAKYERRFRKRFKIAKSRRRPGS